MPVRTTAWIEDGPTEATASKTDCRLLTYLLTYLLPSFLTCLLTYLLSQLGIEKVPATGNSRDLLKDWENQITCKFAMP